MLEFKENEEYEKYLSSQPIHSSLQWHHVETVWKVLPLYDLFYTRNNVEIQRTVKYIPC